MFVNVMTVTASLLFKVKKKKHLGMLTQAKWKLEALEWKNDLKYRFQSIFRHGKALSNTGR